MSLGRRRRSPFCLEEALIGKRSFLPFFLNPPPFMQIPLDCPCAPSCCIIVVFLPLLQTPFQRPFSFRKPPRPCLFLDTFSRPPPFRTELPPPSTAYASFFMLLDVSALSPVALLPFSVGKSFSRSSTVFSAAGHAPPPPLLPPNPFYDFPPFQAAFFSHSAPPVAKCTFLSSLSPISFSPPTPL